MQPEEVCHKVGLCLSAEYTALCKYLVMVECCDTSLLRVSAKLWSSYAESHIESATTTTTTIKINSRCLAACSCSGKVGSLYNLLNTLRLIVSTQFITNFIQLQIDLPCSMFILFYVNLHNLWFLFRIVASVETIKSDIKQTISYHISNLVNFTKWTMNEMQMIFPIYLFPIDSHDSGPGAAVPSLAAHLS